MKKEHDIKTIIAISKLLGEIIPYECKELRWSDFSEIKRLNEEYLIMKKAYDNVFPYSIYSIKKNKIVNGFRENTHLNEVFHTIEYFLEHDGK